jgi:hypothetical protein
MTEREPDSRKVERLLSRHGPPEPEDRLRREILAAAASSVQNSAPPGLGERIWLSGAWRLGWAAAVVLLLLGQLVMGRSVERATRRLLDPAAGSTRLTEDPAASMAEMVVRELGLEIGGSIALAASSPRPRPHQPLTELPPEE